MLKCCCRTPKRRGYRIRLAWLAASTDRTTVLTRSIRSFLQLKFSKFDLHRTHWQPPGEPVRLPEWLHAGSRTASHAREMKSRAHSVSMPASVVTAVRLGRVAKSSLWPAAVMQTARWVSGVDEHKGQGERAPAIAFETSTIGHGDVATAPLHASSARIAAHGRA